MQEEEVIYEDEDEMEYVEVETEKEKIKNKKQLYMENDYSEQLESPINKGDQLDKENTSELSFPKKSRSTRASKRPIQRSKETLDIEPVDEKNYVIDNSQSESVEIDDPW